MSGGGSSGKVGFATYVEDVHEDWIGNAAGANLIALNVPEAMNELLDESDANPYSQAGSTSQATDSGAYLATTDLQQIVDAYNDLIESTGLLQKRTGDELDSRPQRTMEEFSRIFDGAFNVVDGRTKDAVDISAMIQTVITANIANATAIALSTVTGSITNSNSIMDAAISKAVEVINSQPITEAIAVFAANIAPQVNAIKARFSAGMVDINSIMSSAFIFGNSNIEVQRIKSINDFTSTLTVGLYNQSIAAYIQSALGLSAQEMDAFNKVFITNASGQGNADMAARNAFDTRYDAVVHLTSQMFHNDISNDITKVTVAQNVYQTKINENQEQYAENLRINAEELLWNLNVIRHGSNILSSLNTGGGQLIPEGASKKQKQASGALAGGIAGSTLGASAFAGAKAGSFLGVHGAAVGTAIGIGAGLFAGS